MTAKAKEAERRCAEDLKVVDPLCAGIDIDKNTHYAVINPELRNFLLHWGPRGNGRVADLAQCVASGDGVDRAGLEVMPVPIRMTGRTSGRKSDVKDCRWIRKSAAHGLLRGAFRPPDSLCPLRSFVRQRRNPVEERAGSVQHIRKVLTRMNIRLDSVIGDVMGKTG